MNEKQKVLRLIEAMQQKEKDGSLLWCVAEDLKTMASSLTDDEANVTASNIRGSYIDESENTKSFVDSLTKTIVKRIESDV